VGLLEVSLGLTQVAIDDGEVGMAQHSLKADEVRAAAQR
jgi:hypothetical protein